MSSVSKMEIDPMVTECESPYITAIQNLPGKTPGEKYKYINQVVQEIINTYKDTEDLSSIIGSTGIPKVLIPFVKINVGLKLKLHKEVEEALKLRDIKVVNRALKATWFFKGSNDFINAQYFTNEILPHLSYRTRLRLFKVIARGLLGEENKSEEFFNTFLHQYGIQQSLVFLPFCKGDFILNTISKYEIKLPIRYLKIVLKRYPDVAITCIKNWDDLSSLTSFLPKLVEHSPKDLFYLIHDTSYRIKLGDKRIRRMFKAASSKIVDYPHYAIENWSLKKMYYCMSEEQFEKMYTNLLPTYAHNFEFCKMLRYLKYYPKIERLNFMLDTYKEKYRCVLDKNKLRSVDCHVKEVSDLLTIEDFEKIYRIIYPKHHTLYIYAYEDSMFDLLAYYPKEKKLELIMDNFHPSTKDIIVNLNDEASQKLIRLMSEGNRRNEVTTYMELYSGNLTKYHEWCCFLPGEESYEILKTAADNTILHKESYIKYMINSCEINNNQEYLWKVLCYTNNLHETSFRFKPLELLEYLLEKFDLVTLNDSNWQILLKIIRRLYVKNQFIHASQDFINSMIEGSLQYFLPESKKQHVTENILIHLNYTIQMYLEFIIETDIINEWTILETIPELELEFISNLLNEIPRKYPDNHIVWEKSDKKLKIMTKIINKLRRYNQKLRTRNRSNNLPINKGIIKISDYPWLIKSTTDALAFGYQTESNFLNLKNSLRNFDRHFYSSLLNRMIFHKSMIKLGEARLILKNDKGKILADLGRYFEELQILLCFNVKAAKKFVLSFRWYNDLPVIFMKQCLSEIGKHGSLSILGLILEGDILSKVIQPFIPTKSIIDIHRSDAKNYYQIQTCVPAAINLTEPPVAFEILLPFFQGVYINLAECSIQNFIQRVEKSELLILAKQLIERSDNLSQYGVQMIFQVASTEEIRIFLKEIWNCRGYSIISKTIARNVRKQFIKLPTLETWGLVEDCIINFGGNDIEALNILSRTTGNINNYTSLYVMGLLTKVESLSEQGILDNEKKNNIIKNILENLEPGAISLLPKHTIVGILRKYFFKAESKIIYEAASSFGRGVFNLTFEKIQKIAKVQ